MTRALVVQHDHTLEDAELRSLHALGCEVVLCGGPDQGACPVLAGHPCPLAEHADVLIYDIGSLTYSNGAGELIEELRELYRDKPLIVVGEGERGALDPIDRGEVVWLRGAVSDSRLDLAIEEALGDR